MKIHRRFGAIDSVPLIKIKIYTYQFCVPGRLPWHRCSKWRKRIEWKLSVNILIMPWNMLNAPAPHAYTFYIHIKYFDKLSNATCDVQCASWHEFDAIVWKCNGNLDKISHCFVISADDNYAKVCRELNMFRGNIHVHNNRQRWDLLEHTTYS